MLTAPYWPPAKMVDKSTGCVTLATTPPPPSAFQTTAVSTAAPSPGLTGDDDHSLADTFTTHSPSHCPGTAGATAAITFVSSAVS